MNFSAGFFLFHEKLLLLKIINPAIAFTKFILFTNFTPS
jgi:hypothetical protein